MSLGPAATPTSVSPAAPPSDPISTAVLRTHIGLIVLAVGVVLDVLPQIGILGGFAGLAGIGLLLSGRIPFGRRHARLLVAGFILAILGSAGSAFLGLSFPQAIGTPPASNADVTPWLQALAASFSEYLLSVAGFAALTSLGLVLLTYELQARVGRALLWTGFGLGTLINVAVWYVISQEFDLVVAGLANGGTLDLATVNAIFIHLQQFTLLSLIPAGIFAGCFYLASDRIRNGAVTIRPGAIPRPEAVFGGTR